LLTSEGDETGDDEGLIDGDFVVLELLGEDIGFFVGILLGDDVGFFDDRARHKKC